MTDAPFPARAADRPDAWRSLGLSMAGAVIGLAIAGFGLFTARGTRTSDVPPADAAIVNQVPILMSDYITQLRALYDVSPDAATPAQRRRVLDDMIREELYVQRGVELGLTADTSEVRVALVGAVEAQATADATMSQPDEGELRAYHAAHRARYSEAGRMTLEEYVLPGADAAAAGHVAATLRSGHSAAASGLRRSGRMAEGEEFYFAARGHLGEPLFAAARALADGAVSDPVMLADGAHILVMRRNIPPVPLPYGEVRDRVLADAIADKAAVLTAGNDRFLRKRADILIQPGLIR